MEFQIPGGGGTLVRLNTLVSIAVGGDANLLLAGLLSPQVSATLSDADGILNPGDTAGWSGSDGSSNAVFVGYGEAVLLDVLGLDIGFPSPVLVFQVYYPGVASGLASGLGAGMRTYLYYPDGAPLLAGVSMSISLTTIGYDFTDGMPVCFARGTLIETCSGLRNIEDLAAGDLVRTKDDGLQEIRWIGSRVMPARGSMAPVLFCKGAIGNKRPLLVSQQHSMLITGWKAQLLFGEDEVLVPAKHLVNDHSIRLQPGGLVEYFHVMFDRHQIIFAEGVPSESFHPGDTAMSALDSAARHEIFDVFPELKETPACYGVLSRRHIKAFEARLLRN
ncbi:Hint domain-containing protein [Xinfangfangia sp. D13-10-4-6]|uniref:Hint domain-containing protein n=1 Tax=Pseudogemmobacter hezensis TaxID=2737662 RepID=UPI001557E4AA|nr:Hint domain-containing protein [Pseudogemmobacter hezensis]NPD15979.1 Hint domain-containing protein [Pseudogemmobacter hezensis]